MIVVKDTRKFVRDLLEEFGITRPPVPVKRIAKKLGLLIAPIPANDEISGALIRDGSRIIIAVNSSHHINRQRFTIAHELGHYYMHGDMTEHVDQNLRVAWRNADSSKAVDWKEIAANRFAAELLMPTSYLRRDLDSLERIGKRTIALLASKYGVSGEAMKIRLNNFGILGPF